MPTARTHTSNAERIGHNQGDIIRRREAWSRRYRESDEAAGIETTDEFEPFEQRNDMFTLAFWDDRIKSPDAERFFHSYRIEAAPRLGEGFNQKDFALRNAAWLISDIISERSAQDGRREGFQSAIRYDTPVAPDRVEIGDPGAASGEIKNIAKLFSADLVGITDFDDRWLYSSRVDTRDFSAAPLDLPEGLGSVIVLGHAMDYDLVRTYPLHVLLGANRRRFALERSGRPPDPLRTGGAVFPLAQNRG